MIVVGIGLTATLGSFNTWLILRAEHDVAMAAATWGAGSPQAVGWGQAAAVAGTGLLLVPLLLVLRPATRVLELGDEAATALGVRVEPVRLGLLAAGVVLTATVIAAAGPIAFVALAAPQIARRLGRSPGVPLALSGAVGAAILAAADYAVEQVIPRSLPVGALTVVLGGAYLIGLLIGEQRRASVTGRRSARA